jgi:hypothetical protein
MDHGEELEPGAGPAVFREGLILRIVIPAAGRGFGRKREDHHAVFARRDTCERDRVVVTGYERSAVLLEERKESLLVCTKGAASSIFRLTTT